MIICLDLGNTNIDVGVYLETRKLVCHFKLHTDNYKSESEYLNLIDSFLSYNKISKDEIKGSIISSVVPNLTKKLIWAIEHLTNTKCLLVSKNLKSGLKIQIDNPNELGSDLLCDALSSYNNYKNNCIIVDLGTVSKILFVSENKEYKGGILFPGIQLQKESLFKNAAMLYDTEFNFYDSLICKSTSSAISNGILYEVLYTIKGYTHQIEKQFDKPVTKILTGGDSYIFKDKLEGFIYNKYLTLEGLFDLYMKNN